MMKIYDPPRKMPFHGFMKPFIKGADKNHNPRKGTETTSYRRITNNV